MKWLDYITDLFPSKQQEKINSLEEVDVSEREATIKELSLSKDLEENITTIKKIYGDSYDLVIRRVKVGPKNQVGALLYLDGMIDSRAIEQDILKPLNVDSARFNSLLEDESDFFKIVFEQLLNNRNISQTDILTEALTKLAGGYSIIFFAGTAKAILCDTQEFEMRSMEEPEGEISLRGPRDSFVESIAINTSLLRRRLRTPHLWIENMELGALSKTNVAIAYIKGLVSEELVNEVKARLEDIELDNIMEAGYLVEYLVDQPFTLFPLTQRTERPDRALSCLVEGKIAILTDGTPFVLIVPATYNSLLQAPDDYYEIVPIGSFIRVMRHISFLMSILLPGLYVAIATYHLELMPVSLVLRIAATREGVPFPLVFEVVTMEVLFEVLREAGLRLPKAFGAAISIVGALILGEAAIGAGLVSPMVVIIVALTAISSFTTPDYSLSLAARLLRFFFLFLGSILGLFGIQLGFLLVLIHLVSLRSFGQPYFSPYGPLVWSDLKDSIIRSFWWTQKKRPKLTGGREPNRQKSDQKPKPPDAD